MLEEYKNILWDFDGVILNSMPIRDRGFEEIFQNYNENQVEELLQFHRENGGWSRYVKIEHFFKNIVHEEYTEQRINEYAERFSIIMKRELTKKKYLINDTVEFLQSNYNKFNFHIVSGSDHKELNFLCKQLEIHHFFISISGSPTPKIKLVENIMISEEYEQKETCLIGDSINDFEAAAKNSIDFFAYNNLVLSKDHKYINSFSEL